MPGQVLDNVLVIMVENQYHGYVMEYPGGLGALGH